MGIDPHRCEAGKRSLTHLDTHQRMDPTSFQVTLVDPVAQLCKELRTHFRGLKRVNVCHGRFEELDSFDCMVSAANSFGLMDGGVDLAITNYFGIELMDRVQRAIIDEFRGEQPVGTCLIVETLHPKHPHIAHSPTMRVPMTIATTDNVYLAMWAMLTAVWKHNQTSEQMIRREACPGLGTACGQVDFVVAAKQMSLAYRNFLDPPAAISWHTL